MDLYEKEIIPGFASRGMEAEATEYVRLTVDRFQNPFLNHRVADIANGHAEKVKRRAQGFLDWVGMNDTLQMPRLRALAAFPGDAPGERR